MSISGQKRLVRKIVKLVAIQVHSLFETSLDVRMSDLNKNFKVFQNAQTFLQAPSCLAIQVQLFHGQLRL